MIGGLGAPRLQLLGDLQAMLASTAIACLEQSLKP